MTNKTKNQIIKSVVSKNLHHFIEGSIPTKDVLECISSEVKRIEIEQKSKKHLNEVYAPNFKKLGSGNYIRISPVDTGLNVSLWMDEAGIHKYFKHPLWVFVDAISNKDYANSYFPMTVEDNPKIVGDTTHIKLSSKEINDVKRYIKVNKTGIIKLASRKIDRSLYCATSANMKFINLNENRYDNGIDLIAEMANFFKKETGLRVNMWAEEDVRNKKHGNRLKVQNNYGDSMTPGDSFSIGLHDMKIYPKDVEIKIDIFDVKMVRKFLELNPELATYLKNSKYIETSQIDYHKSRMTRFDHKQNPIIQPKEEKLSYNNVGRPYSNGLQLVKSNQGLFNLENRNGQLVSKGWFNSFHGTFVPCEDGRTRIPVQISNEWKWLYDDGTIIPYSTT